MAKLSNFIYCLSADKIQAPDGKGDSINAMGVLSAITPEFVPGTFSFSIIFTILDIDKDKYNKIQVVFMDDNKILVDSGVIQLPIIPEDEKNNLPNEYTGFNMCMDFRNVVFEKEGLYYTKVLFNDSPLGDRSIYVKGRR